MQRGGDPWRHAPVEELQDQVLPRWFVLTALATIPLAIAVLIVALGVFRPAEVPVQARRPAPEGGLTHAVGDLAAGHTEPVPYADACRPLEGVRIAGSSEDQRVLRAALAALCNTPLDPPEAGALEAFADAGGVVRFGTFEATGVDSTLAYERDPPVLYVNTKFSRTEPLWIAPLIAHDTTHAALGPGEAEAALAARRAEDKVCDRLLGTQRRSRACADAEALLDLPDPLQALRDAGYR